MPKFLARPRIKRIDMVERRREIHHAIDDDRRGFHRVLHFGLEYPGRAKIGDIADIDLLVRVVARLRVIAIRQQEIVAIAARAVEQILRDRCHISEFRRVLDFLGLGDREPTGKTGGGAKDQKALFE